MKIQKVISNKDKRRYIRFIYEVYQNDKNFSDLNILFVKTFLYGLDDYARRASVLPLIIEDNGIKLVGTFISTADSKELKLSFLEFLPDSGPYIRAILDYGQTLLKDLGLSRIIVGINGQISYGLGILTAGSSRTFEFNANYHPAYYTEELDRIIEGKKRAFSYRFSAEHVLSAINPALIDKVLSTYSIRKMDKKHFREEMLIFGRLCHEALQGTPYYADKTPDEMYQLMKKIRFLLKNEDILFAMKDGQEIGFVLHHPDYAEFCTKPRVNYLLLFLRTLYKRPKTLIYNAIGVLPEYQQSGLVAALLYHSIHIRKEHYATAVSSFILEENIPSLTLFKKLSEGIHKEYRIYEIEKKE